MTWMSFYVKNKISFLWVKGCWLAVTKGRQLRAHCEEIWAPVCPEVVLWDEDFEKVEFTF